VEISAQRALKELRRNNKKLKSKQKSRGCKMRIHNLTWTYHWKQLKL